MSDFRVGEPTKVPTNIGAAKYADLIASVRILGDGLAIPLEFTDPAVAGAFHNANVNNFKRQGVRLRKRGAVIYLSPLEPLS